MYTVIFTKFLFINYIYFFMNIFNKDQLLNSSEIIQDLANSYGMLSKETILSKHPFVKDVQLELKRLAKEEAMQIDDAYPNH